MKKWKIQFLDMTGKDVFSVANDSNHLESYQSQFDLATQLLQHFQQNMASLGIVATAFKITEVT